MTLSPPYAVAVRNGRALIVPENRFFEGGTAHPLCEVLPYGSVDVQEVGAAIANRLNWHPQLVEALAGLLREFGPRRIGMTYTAAQKAELLQAAEVLKSVHQT